MDIYLKYSIKFDTLEAKKCHVYCALEADLSTMTGDFTFFIRLKE